MKKKSVVTGAVAGRKLAVKDTHEVWGIKEIFCIIIGFWLHGSIHLSQLTTLHTPNLSF